MQKYSLEERVELTTYVVNELNEFWIKYDGVLFNQRDFWDNTLHKFNNEDWEILMDVMALIRLEDDSCYLPYSQSVFDDVRKVLMMEGHSGNPKALDARKHKKLAFKALMNIRDVVNAFLDYKQPTKFVKDDEPTQFQTLFDY